MSRRELDAIKRAVAGLDAVDREVFLAHRLDELPFDRIAIVSGRSVSEIERRIAMVMLMIDREVCRSR